MVRRRRGKNLGFFSFPFSPTLSYRNPAKPHARRGRFFFFFLFFSSPSAFLGSGCDSRERAFLFFFPPFGLGWPTPREIGSQSRKNVFFFPSPLLLLGNRTRHEEAKGERESPLFSSFFLFFSFRWFAALRRKEGRMCFLFLSSFFFFFFFLFSPSFSLPSSVGQPVMEVGPSPLFFFSFSFSFFPFVGFSYHRERRAEAPVVSPPFLFSFSHSCTKLQENRSESWRSFFFFSPLFFLFFLSPPLHPALMMKLRAALPFSLPPPFFSFCRLRAAQSAGRTLPFLFFFFFPAFSVCKTRSQRSELFFSLFFFFLLLLFWSVSQLTSSLFFFSFVVRDVNG